MSTELEGATVSWRADTLVVTVTGGRLPTKSVRAVSLAGSTKAYGGRPLVNIEVHFADEAAAQTQAAALASGTATVWCLGKPVLTSAKCSVGTDFGIHPDGSGIDVDE